MITKKQQIPILEPPSEFEENIDLFNFQPDESGKTICILGRGFSGKTFFLVQQLNMLVGKTRPIGNGKVRRPMYDKIIMFTESLSAQPLEGLSKELDITMISGYIPRIVHLLKRINTVSDNRFRFLIILDDVISGIRSGTVEKQILTMRNSNISTCMLIQYAKLINAAMRNSIHHYYITGIKPEEWDYLLRSFLLSLVKEKIGEHGPITRLCYVFKEWVGSNIVHYDQRFDKLTLIKRELKK